MCSGAVAWLEEAYVRARGNEVRVREEQSMVVYISLLWKVRVLPSTEFRLLVVCFIYNIAAWCASSSSCREPISEVRYLLGCD